MHGCPARPYEARSRAHGARPHDPLTGRVARARAQVQQLISTCKQLCEPGAQEVPWERLKLMQIKDKMLAKLQETGPS